MLFFQTKQIRLAISIFYFFEIYLFKHKTSIKQRWDSNFNINFKVKVKLTEKCIVLALAIFIAAPGLPQWKFYGAHNFLGFGGFWGSSEGGGNF
jgi:hypothetical protein